MMQVKRYILIFLVACAIQLKISAADEQGPLKEFATYEEVKDLPNHPEKYLIEVRSRDMVEMDGAIPTSINIPCK